MSSVLTLLFAPTFLLFVQYFEFKTVTLVYILLSFITLIYVYIKKKKKEEYAILTIYLLLLSAAFFTNSFNAVKFIPVFSAMTFCAIFTYGAIHKKELIYKFATRMSKKQFTDEEASFLKKGDAFWAWSILFYAVFLMFLVYNADDNLWAFFSSIGWYIYFLFILGLQIFYGKIYAIKMYSK